MMSEKHAYVLENHGNKSNIMNTLTWKPGDWPSQKFILFRRRFRNGPNNFCKGWQSCHMKMNFSNCFIKDIQNVGFIWIIHFIQRTQSADGVDDPNPTQPTPDSATADLTVATNMSPYVGRYCKACHTSSPYCQVTTLSALHCHLM